jgi:hypothetical protein
MPGQCRHVRAPDPVIRRWRLGPAHFPLKTSWRDSRQRTLRRHRPERACRRGRRPDLPAGLQDGPGRHRVEVAERAYRSGSSRDLIKARTARRCSGPREAEWCGSDDSPPGRDKPLRREVNSLPKHEILVRDAAPSREGKPMTSSTESDIPKCPGCNEKMRLTRVLPTVLPKSCGTETRVFTCTNCGTTITRTVHGAHSQ